MSKENVDNTTDSDYMMPGSMSFLAFLTLLNVMNFIDRGLLGSFANFIVPDLGLTNTEFGLLTGLVFLFFYSTMGLFMGALADRVNRTRLIAAGLALWSILTAVSGAARGFVSLALPRMFIGVGESIMTPTSMSLISDRFPSSKLGFASGFSSCCINPWFGIPFPANRLHRVADSSESGSTHVVMVQQISCSCRFVFPYTFF